MSLEQVKVSLKRLCDSQKDAHKIDFEMFERKFREILNELSTKKLQVEQLRKELDNANLLIHDLKGNLDSSKTMIREKAFNLEIALQNNKNLGEKLQNHLNYATKTKMQYESSISENTNIREQLRKLELEHCELTRKLKDVEMQHQNDVAYQNDLISKNSKIEASMDELNRKFDQIRCNQDNFLKTSEKLNICQDLESKVTYYQEELKRCKKENFELEKQNITIKATADKFSYFINTSTFFKNYSNTNGAVEEWKLVNNELKNEITHMKDIVIKLTEKLAVKEAENRKLCEWQTELEEKNLKLNEQLKNLNGVKESSNISTQTDESDLK